ncbi:MAG: peptide deformylase [Candidatus Dojkabacteria bacterium]|jgi:peptide deformylase|nr:peptide deformylase [Candidatus Dojkabacteria bacterium]MDD2270035.1 peptide deformylase [Candidatus Dojkabacteria bacterium]
MKQLKIFTIEDPKEEKILRKISKDVSIEEIKSEDFQQFLKDLLFTAKNSEDQVGIESGGISAPQVGVNKRVVYIFNYETEEFEVLINPVVQNIGNKTEIDIEGCLSVPNTEKNVKRFKKIKVKYIDKEGQKVNRRFTGLNSRVVQHENDHLDGVLFIDKAID